MKTHLLKTVVFCLALNLPVMASTDPVTATPTLANTPTLNEAKAQQLVNRLEEIKAMDKSDMSRAEKKALRKEVKEIRTTLRTSNGGVYLSVGAIIIIILLLILLV